MVESPMVESPMVESPMVESPMVESPMVESPMAESPMAEAPVAEAPSLEEPPAGASENAELDAELERIRQLVPSGSHDQLGEAFAAARELADRYPQLTEPQHLAAEIAYRLSRWQDAVTFFERGGEPDYPDRLFYFAVALFKTGGRAEARRMLEQCLPSLEMTAYVQSYVAEIMGTDPGAPDDVEDPGSAGARR